MDFDIIFEIINFFYANKHLYERMNGIKPYYALLAQLEERGISNPDVMSSSLLKGAKTNEVQVR